MKKLIGAMFAGVMLLGACLPPETTGRARDATAPSSIFAGIYQGTLPCADCAGIKTSLALSADGIYRLTEEYLGGPSNQGKSTFVTKGHFQWDKAGTGITLDAAANGQQYRLKDGKLLFLDHEGQPITGALASNYTLTRLP